MSRITFASGTYEKIQSAITQGVLVYPSYAFITDENKLAFIDKDLDIRIIVGNNKKQVLQVDELPQVYQADVETLYIFNNIVYTFNGERFTPMYVDYTDKIEQLELDIEELKQKVEQLESPSEDIITNMIDSILEERLDEKLNEQLQPVTSDTIINLF